MKRIGICLLAILILASVGCTKYTDEDIAQIKESSYQEGYTNGHETGKALGYEEGYDTGAKDGYDKCLDEIWGHEDGSAIQYSFYEDIIRIALEKGYLTPNAAEWMKETAEINSANASKVEILPEHPWADNPDYNNEVDFENALNNGAEVVGKTVTFTVGEVHPDSAFGVNIWAGKHLNFCSVTNPGFSTGDTVTVKVTTCEKVLGSYIIYYELP